jgi:hypothetical protein
LVRKYEAKRLWVRLVTCIEEKHIKILARKPEAKGQLERSRCRLEFILNRLAGKVWTGCIWVRMGTYGRLL